MGALISTILCVKHKGKWKKRLCTLLKPATFTDSLKLLVMDKTSSSYRIEDVIHAFLWFLDPNHHSTLMLVCDYKARCISFDCIDELTAWVELLKKHLKCNYFHADLVLASKKSNLYNHARRRCRQLRSAPSHKRSHNSMGTNGTGMLFRVSAACSDGYLHVTRDRICFTTGPNCARPRLLACWSFENDDLIQCGTARAKRHVIESDSLFFLTASPEHPEAPGGHLFVSDRANELCEWIEANSRTAIYQAEWRRLTSIAVALDTTSVPSSPSTVSPPHFGVDPPNGLVEHPTSFTVLRSTNFSNLRSKQCPSCGLPVCEHPTECSHDVRELDASNMLTCVSTEHAQIEKQLQEALEEVSDRESQGSAPQSSLSAGSSPHEQHVQSLPHGPTESGLADTIRLPTDSPPCDLHSSTEPHSTVTDPSTSNLAQTGFAARKRSAMNSRRRFSSHPVDGMSPVTSQFGYRCQPCERLSMRHISACTSLGPTTCSVQNTPLSHSPCTASESHLLLRHGWRQSEPQLVTLPSQPVPLHELGCFLRRLKGEHSHLHGSPQSCDAAAPHDCLNQTVTECNSSRNEDISFGVSTFHRLSECSTTSTSEFVHSSQPPSPCSCPHCVPAFVASEAKAPFVDSDTPSAEPPDNDLPANRRKRLPSSWSTTVSTSQYSNLTGYHIRTQSDTFQGDHPPLLSRSVSSGRSPQCMYTPLLPTSNVIPGSQYFFHRRYHTASASEAATTSSSRQDSRVIAESFVSIAPTSQISFRHTAKASLVSLSPSSLPLWAEAPGWTKPRTGRNYVSREALLNLHSQRKQLQSSDPSSPSGGRDPDSQLGAPNSPIPPDSLDPTLSGVTRRNSSVQPHSIKCTHCVTNDKHDAKLLAPSHFASESSGDPNQSPVSDRRMEPRSLSIPDDTSITEPPCIEVPPAVSQEQLLSSLERSYINVVPTRRVSLLPIDEREAVRLVPSQPMPMPLRSRDPSTSEDSSTNTRVPTLDEVSSGPVITLSSYVNVSDLSKYVVGTGTNSTSSSFSSMPSATDVSASPQHYVNLTSPGTTISLNEHFHGLHNIPQRLPQSLHDTHLSNETDNVVPIPSTSSACSPRKACSSTASHTPRLHYAHLTLSTGRAWQSVATTGQSPGSLTLSRSAATMCSSDSRGIDSVSDTVPYVSCCPSACGSSSSPKGLTVAGGGDGDSSSTDLNYVTIDLFQTKALSEVEKELRLQATSETASRSLLHAGRHQRWRTNSRRSLIVSNTLPTSVPRDTPSSGSCNASCHSGPCPGDSLCSSSLSSRIFHRLVASFHSQSGSTRKSSSSSSSGCRHLHQFGRAV